ncbi:MAG: hypothetical protein ACYDIA_01870 [Candidatus Humimicrobiaceae bacterium]
MTLEEKIIEILENDEFDKSTIESYFANGDIDYGQYEKQIHEVNIDIAKAIMDEIKESENKDSFIMDKQSLKKLKSIPRGE